MQQNPALAQQAMAMAGQQAGGGVPPAMPGCVTHNHVCFESRCIALTLTGMNACMRRRVGVPAMPLGGQLAPPPQPQQQGGQPQQRDDAGMTEEEMLQEAINRWVLVLVGA